ncbi:hypothetical protein [Persicobacter sp. CCB-QB2]|uniref:hypothetical protein n=1 Tax=Persicobacter sp. CCB-QB2 TaxID=1561025 RepID=UPI0006A9FFB7|nr:hypothetical protein [Persicobacter sp. CCB-QB2]
MNINDLEKIYKKWTDEELAYVFYLHQFRYGTIFSRILRKEVESRKNINEKWIISKILNPGFLKHGLKHISLRIFQAFLGLTALLTILNIHFYLDPDLRLHTALIIFNVLAALFSWLAYGRWKKIEKIAKPYGGFSDEEIRLIQMVRFKEAVDQALDEPALIRRFFREDCNKDNFQELNQRFFDTYGFDFHERVYQYSDDIQIQLYLLGTLREKGILRHEPPFDVLPPWKLKHQAQD